MDNIQNKKYPFTDSCEFREFCEYPATARVTGCESFANSCEFPANSQNNTGLRLQFATVSHCRDTQPRLFDAEWLWMVRAFSQPKIRLEKDGKAIIFGVLTKPYRAAANVSAVTALGFDIECNKEDGSVPPPASEAAAMVSRTGTEAVIHTTFSHHPNAPRYRIIFPLDKPLPPPDLKLALLVVAGAIGGVSHWIDRTCKDAARLFYLPSCPPDKATLFEFYHVTGDILSTDTLQVLIAHKKATLEAKRAAKAQRLNAGGVRKINAKGGVIQRFNATFPLDAILQSHGYERRGKRWLSPASSSGIAGVHAFEDGRMFSHHTDILGNQGTLSDSFEAFALLEYGGDKSSATKAAARLLAVRL